MEWEGLTLVVTLTWLAALLHGVVRAGNDSLVHPIIPRLQRLSTITAKV